MIVSVSLFLWLFHSVSCQIQSPEEARNIACDIALDGLTTADTECSLAAARSVLVTNGLEGSLSMDNLNQLCGPTPCAELLDIVIMCSGEKQIEKLDG